jgi:hypothetical protein
MTPNVTIFMVLSLELIDAWVERFNVPREPGLREAGIAVRGYRTHASGKFQREAFFVSFVSPARSNPPALATRPRLTRYNAPRYSRA